MSGEVTVGGVDTTSLHSFIRGAFPNAVLLEEYQVAIGLTLFCEALHVYLTSLFRVL